MPVMEAIEIVTALAGPLVDLVDRLRLWASRNAAGGAADPEDIELAEYVGQLANVVNELRSAVEELTGVVNSNADVVEQQSRVLEEHSKVFEELGESAQEFIRLSDRIVWLTWLSVGSIVVSLGTVAALIVVLLRQ